MQVSTQTRLKKKRGEALILSFKEPFETNDRRALSLGYVHVRSVLTLVRKLRDTSKIHSVDIQESWLGNINKCIYISTPSLNTRNPPQTRSKHTPQSAK